MDEQELAEIREKNSGARSTTISQPATSNPRLELVQRVMERLSSADQDVLKLEKEIITLAYGEERKKAEIIEQRAYQMIQFSKIGLTAIVGITAFLSNNVSSSHSHFRVLLVFLMLLAAVFLGKALWKGSAVMAVGTIFRPIAHVKLDHHDVLDIQNATSLYALKRHVAQMLIYYDHTAKDNLERVYDCKSCWANILCFLTVFCIFFCLCVFHVLFPDFTRQEWFNSLVVFSLSAMYVPLLFQGILERISPWLRRDISEERF